jgi:hypothetical protein
LVCLDPAPRASVDSIADKIEKARLEDSDLTVFDTLAPNDVVFFDGSHRCLQNSDVTVFFLEVIPRLKPGVVVGIHDIFWPRDYPDSWFGRYYSEQYILGAFMLPFGSRFPLIFSSAYAGLYLRDEIAGCLTPEQVSSLTGRLSGGCVWFVRPEMPPI